VPLAEQELLTLPEHLSSPPSFWWSSCYSLFSSICNVLQIIVCPFSFSHCVVCLSSIYGFWLSLWYLQTLLVDENNCIRVYMNMHEIAIPCKIILISFSATQSHSTNKHKLQYSCVDNEHEVTVHSGVWLVEYVHFM